MGWISIGFFFFFVLDLGTSNVENWVYDKTLPWLGFVLRKLCSDLIEKVNIFYTC